MALVFIIVPLRALRFHGQWLLNVGQELLGGLIEADLG
jgi:hypothetical protein